MLKFGDFSSYLVSCSCDSQKNVWYDVTSVMVIHKLSRSQEKIVWAEIMLLIKTTRDLSRTKTGYITISVIHPFTYSLILSCIPLFTHSVFLDICEKKSSKFVIVFVMNSLWQPWLSFSYVHLPNLCYSIPTLLSRPQNCSTDIYVVCYPHHVESVRY